MRRFVIIDLPFPDGRSAAWTPADHASSSNQGKRAIGQGAGPGGRIGFGVLLQESGEGLSHVAFYGIELTGRHEQG